MADLAPARGSPAAEETTAWRRTNRAANPDEAPFGPMAPVLREAAWTQSQQFTPVSFGEDGGQDQLWWNSGWRRRSDAGNHITGDPVGHLLA